MTGKFVITLGVAVILTLSGASLGAILTSSMPTFHKGIGISAQAEPIGIADIAFCAPKKVPFDDMPVECGASPGKF